MSEERVRTESEQAYSERPLGSKLGTAGVPSLEPPVRQGALARTLRGVVIGLIAGAIIGALEGLGILLMVRSVGKGQPPPTTEQWIRGLGGPAINFAILGAVLVGISQLLFGGWKKKRNK